MQHSDSRKTLIPVFISPEAYRINYNIPDELLYQKEQTTIVSTISRIHPFKGCPYLSFQQLSPSGRAANGLSWVITPNPGQEIIQFLTGQINYTIRWKLKAVANLTGNERVTFLLPFPGEGAAFEQAACSTVPMPAAYEPWDINGNRIRFEVPKRVGCVTFGEFVVPGTYGQFIIESAVLDGLSPVPSYSLSMKMEIIGDREQRCPDPWYYSLKDSAFSLCLPRSGQSCYRHENACGGAQCEKTTYGTNSCSRGKCRPAYINRLDNTQNMIRRVVLPEFEAYNRMIQAKFRRNPRFPCFDRTLTSSLPGQVDPEFYLFESKYYKDDGKTANPLNIITPSYRYDVPPDLIQTCINDAMINEGPYTSPLLVQLVPIPNTGLVIPSGAFESGQFQLAQIPDGSFYRISFRIFVESMSWDELDTRAKQDFNGNVVVAPVTHPGYFCDMEGSKKAEKYLTFTMYNVSDGGFMPVPVRGTSVFPPGQIDSTISITLPYPEFANDGDQFTGHTKSELNMWSTEQGLIYYYDMLTQDEISSNIYAFRVNNLIWNFPGITGIPPDGVYTTAYGGGAKTVSVNVNIRTLSAV